MMIIDSQWKRTALAVQLHCGELIAGQLLPLGILTVPGLQKLVFGFYSCNEGGFINREINWLMAKAVLELSGLDVVYASIVYL